jgi:dihydroorotase
LEGIADGTIEIVGSDHAPHCDFEKESSLTTPVQDRFGDGAGPVANATRSYQPSPAGSDARLRPYQTLRLAKGTLTAGRMRMSPYLIKQGLVFRKEDTASKSRNSPFYNWALKEGHSNDFR